MPLVLSHQHSVDRGFANFRKENGEDLTIFGNRRRMVSFSILNGRIGMRPFISYGR